MQLCTAQPVVFHFQMEAIKITGRTASDLSAGVGAYLMDYANLTFGWPRGGGSHMVLPTTWYGIIHHRFFYTQIERMRH